MKNADYRPLVLAERVLAVLKPDAPIIVMLAGVIVLSTFIGLTMIWPFALLVDNVLTLESSQSYLGRLLHAVTDNRSGQIIFLAAAALGLRLVQEVLQLVRTMLSLRIGHQCVLRVRCALFQKLQTMTLRFHRSSSQGDLLYRVIQDATSCQQVFNVLVELFAASVCLVVMVMILLAKSALLTAVALAVAPLLLFVNLRFAQILSDHNAIAKGAECELTETAQRSIAMVGLTQAFRREGWEFGRFEASTRRSNDAWWNVHWYLAWYRLFAGMIFGMGVALILAVGGYLVYRDQFLLAHSGGLTVGDLVVFVTYLGMLYDPLCKISGAGADIQGGAVGFRRVLEVLDQEPEVKDSPDAQSMELQPRSLTLKNINFSYTPYRPVLSEVNATIRPGQTVAFVGSSGAGKSTLLNMLPRFFDPTGGSIYLDDREFRTIKLHDLRSHIAVVPQESLLLAESIADNIRYGRPDATDEEVRRAAELAGVTEFTDGLPDGLETRLHEGGQNLSGGQRQRIGIARALLTEAPILILDEPTSALDAKAERLITRTLRNLKGQRTIILVSHRLSTVAHSDCIFLLENGKIVEHGTHDELMSSGGAYYQLAAGQMDFGRHVAA